jgi:hypothetical protein
VTPPAAPPARPQRATIRKPRLQRRHKRTAWHFVATAALLLIIWCTITFIQTGGHPVQALTWFSASQPAVATEVPFNAPGRENLPQASQP